MFFNNTGDEKGEQLGRIILCLKHGCTLFFNFILLHMWVAVWSDYYRWGSRNRQIRWSHDLMGGNPFDSWNKSENFANTNSKEESPVSLIEWTYGLSSYCRPCSITCFPSLRKSMVKASKFHTIGPKVLSHCTPRTTLKPSNGNK